MPHDVDAPHGQVERTLAILEALAGEAGGLPLFTLADRLAIPRSATHRILAVLAERGYVRQERDHGDYRLTAKVAALGFTHLTRTGITDLAQAILDRLARTSGELVRLAVLDGQTLTWVARAQGSPHGLRYDPEMGQTARLSCSANGLAWLMTLEDGQALDAVRAQGLGARAEYGPRAPENDAAFLRLLRQARRRGWSEAVQTFAPGMAAMAAPVRHPGHGLGHGPGRGEVVATVSIAGPHLRLTAARMAELAPDLLDGAAQLGPAVAVSPALSARRVSIFQPE